MKNNKSKIVCIRLTESTYKLLARNAKIAEVPISRYISNLIERDLVNPSENNI